MATFRVEVLTSEDEDGANQVWGVAARRQRPGAPLKMDYGRAEGLQSDEAQEIAAALERQGSLARVVAE